MDSLRKWLYRPKRDDPSLLAQFYYADEELNMVASELDTFDGRKDPERCTALVNQLRHCQDKVVSLCMAIMDAIIPGERANRDFRAKFPDDVMQENLAGQLWFGAECLAAGSSILNRESESSRMRPLAKAVTKTIETVRNLLREQCLKSEQEYTEKIRESLKIFDLLFSEFELSYVSAMVPVKSPEEYEVLQCVVVLFSETVQRALLVELITQEQVDACDPALMFTIPRLAIVAGLLFFPDGPLNLDSSASSRSLSHLFRPFKTLLNKIRELLWTMSAEELAALEKSLCSLEEPQHSVLSLPERSTYCWPAWPRAGEAPAEGHEKDASQTPLAFENAAFTSSFIQNFLARHPECRTLTAEDNLLPAPEKQTNNNSSGRRVSSSSDRKRERGSQRSRGSSGSSAHRSASTRARLRQERLSDRFLAKLTGTEERPRVRRKSKKLPASPGPEFAPPAPSGNLMPSVSEALQVLPALLPANATVGVDSLAQLPSLEEAIRLQRAYDLHNERLQKAQMSAASVRRSNTLPASDLAAYINERRGHLPRPLVSEEVVTQPDSESDHDQSHPRPRRHHHTHHRSSQSTDRPRHRSKHSSRGRQRNENELDANGNSVQPNLPHPNWPQERTVSRNGNIPTSRPQSFICVGDESIRSSNDLIRDVEQSVHGLTGMNFSQSSLMDQNLPTNDAEFRVPVSIGECVSSAVAADPSIFGVHNLYHDMPVPDYQLSQPQEFTDRSPQYNFDHINGGDRDSFELGDEVLVSPSLENYSRRRPWHHQASVHIIDSPRETIQSSVLTTTSEAPDGSFGRYHSYYDHQTGGTSGIDEEDQPLFANNYLPPSTSRKNSSAQQLEDLNEHMTTTLALRHNQDENETDVPTTHHRPTSENIESASASALDIEVTNDPSVATAADDDAGDLEKPTCRGVSEDVGESSSSTSSDAGAAFSEDDELNDEEVALALQMAEVATAWRVRARFPDPRDLVQRLFVCISGVADQLQTNYASDLRRILRTVFLLNQTPDPPPDLPHTKGDPLRDPDSHSTSQDSESLSVESAEDALAGIGSSSQPSSPSLSCNFPQPCPLTCPQPCPLAFTEHGLARCSPSEPAPPEAEGRLSPKRPNNAQASPRHDDCSGDDDSASLTKSSLSSSSATTVSSTATSTVSSSTSSTATVSSTTTVCESGRRAAEEPPSWVPDHEAPRCMACGASFTMLRRRHHCRNCGKVFCGGCSEHAVPLTHYGIWRPVRVCNICFLQYVTIASTAS